ncbi:MAG: hypothetical protein HZB25_00905 [Candidatus Eisenbacteria bacterium]|nr:hypothetical protein [Candidatus Eisenbacteria bacterium]
MKLVRVFLFAAVAAGLMLLPPIAMGTDKDGPDDCLRTLIEDMGDAPEDIPAYPGVMGRFPTCAFPSAPGTQTLACPPISTPPGPTGFIRHLQLGNSYWLGCYLTPVGPQGIDSEPDGKTNTPAVGMSVCHPGLPTDCVEKAFGMTFDQDECYADGSDAGLHVMPVFLPCAMAGVGFTTFNCDGPRQVFLNILVDMNEDGDWNDNFPCPTGCAYEWAVKNVPIPLPPGCATLASPPFLVGPRSQNGRGWMRISLTDEPVNDDYPWAGSATTPAGIYRGGETEDYPVAVEFTTDSKPGTWGRLKRTYR